MRLLCVMATDASKVRVVGPGRVQAPLPPFRVDGREHVDDRICRVNVTFRSNRRHDFRWDDVGVIPFLTFSVADVFSNGSLQAFTIMVIVAIALYRRPTFKAVRVLVRRVRFRVFRFQPWMVGIFAFELESQATSGLSFKVHLAGRLSGLFRAFQVFQSPLFIAGARRLRIRKDEVSRVHAGFSPDDHGVAVNGFGRVRYVLCVQVGFKRTSLLIKIVLVLTCRSTIRGERQFNTCVLQRLRVLGRTRSMDLRVVKRRAVLRHVVPTIFVRQAVLCHACYFFPFMANDLVHAFRGATTKGARGAKFSVVWDLRRILTGPILAFFPDVRERGEGVFRVRHSHAFGRGARVDLKFHSQQFRCRLVLFPVLQIRYRFF